MKDAFTAIYLIAVGEWFAGDQPVSWQERGEGNSKLKKLDE